MNYFELYPGDYLRDTTRLTLLEHGAYLRLLMAYYAEEEPLPADHGELFVIVSAVTAADKMAVRKVADRFFPVGPDGLRRNGRADEEIAKAQKRMAASRENGGKGGRPKKPKENPAGNPAGNLVGFESGGFSEPSRNPTKTCSGEALQTPDPTREAHRLTPAASHLSAGERESVALPDGTDPDAWALWESHQATQPRWSAPRRALALGQLRTIAADGGDPTAVLTRATARGLADLADVARSMAAEAAQELIHGTDQSRESLADRNGRRAAEILGRSAEG